ncbi:MAG: PDZ domain-containing protein, partial [Clostridia bacterium]|nr:PDZ domain-containing protein [Clostridia bacterium]
MKKRFNILTLCVAVLLSVVATFQMTYVFCARRQLVSADGELSYNSDKLAYVDEIYRKYFVGEIDGEELTDILIRAYMSGVGERFGGYMNAEEYAARMNSVQGEMVGIGVNVYYPADAEYIQVIAVMDDSPAQEAGMLPGDYIYAVDGVSATELGYDGVLAAVAGEEGTTVTVTVLRDGDETVDLVATRRKIEAQSVYSHMLNDGVTGLIRITSFNTNTPDQFTDAVGKLTAMGMTRVVFDLRGNPGGELNSVSSIL